LRLNGTSKRVGESYLKERELKGRNSSGKEKIHLKRCGEPKKGNLWGRRKKEVSWVIHQGPLPGGDWIVGMPGNSLDGCGK